MQVGPGVFVSSIDTDDWAVDPEVGGELHVLAAVDDARIATRPPMTPGPELSWLTETTGVGTA
jgi:hypothetical protein